MTTSSVQKRRIIDSKSVPKRAVCLSPNVKPEELSSSLKKPKQFDGDLQCSNKRRRYMRRGSKSPSMLQASFATMAPMIQAYASKECMSPKDSVVNKFLYLENEKHLLLNQNAAQRRMSLMSALKISLEKTSIVDNSPPPLNGRKAERRLSTYQLLSQV